MPKYDVGDLIEDRYKVLGILGGKNKSGSGIVYVCREKDNIIALKTLQEQFLASEDLKARFKREALAWVHLDRHPYILKANYVINIDDTPYIALEYIARDKDGRNTLTHYAKSPISLEQALIWSIQICYGMTYSISKGISPHRDIKPDNIMITNDGILKITDFGLAKFLDQEEKVSNWQEIAESGKMGLSFLRFSKGQVIGGTVPWMAPEQFDGISNIQSDIYGFGIVLYQMANNGKLPFEYKDITDFQIAHKNEPVKPLDSKLFPIIERCLQKKPKYRYQDFEELRIDLEKLYIDEIGKESPKPPEEKDLDAWEHNNKGVSFANIGLIDEAIEEFEKALEINPYYVNAHANLGFLYKQNDMLDEAIKEFKAASSQGSIDFSNTLAELFMEKGLIDQAIQEYRHILILNPSFMQGHYNLAKAYEKNGSYEEAEFYYKNYLEFGPRKKSEVAKLVTIPYEKFKKHAQKRLRQIDKILKRKKKY